MAPRTLGACACIARDATDHRHLRRRATYGAVAAKNRVLLKKARRQNARTATASLVGSQSVLALGVWRVEVRHEPPPAYPHLRCRKHTSQSVAPLVLLSIEGIAVAKTDAVVSQSVACALALPCVASTATDELIFLCRRACPLSRHACLSRRRTVQQTDCADAIAFGATNRWAGKGTEEVLSFSRAVCRRPGAHGTAGGPVVGGKQRVRGPVAALAESRPRLKK
eukprot:6212393-Pleurochrysis_carterae.AAC.2